MRNKNITIVDKNCTENPLAFDIMLKSHKGARTFYDVLMETTEVSKACKKWDSIFEMEIDWTKVFAKTMKIKEIKLKWFQHM